jgi:hypothetical protein
VQLALLILIQSIELRAPSRTHHLATADVINSSW